MKPPTLREHAVYWADLLLRLEESLSQYLQRYVGGPLTDATRMEMQDSAHRWLRVNTPWLSDLFRFTINEHRGAVTISLTALDISRHPSRDILKARTMLLEERWNRG
jgi:hypothetical protein